MRNGLCFFLLVCLLLPRPLPAQQVYTEQFTDREGLTSLTIYDLLAGQQGYIWAGTETGLFRFNGKRFTPIKGYDGSVSYLSPDPQGRLWCYAFSGRLLRLSGDSLEEPLKRLGYIRQYAFNGPLLYVGTFDGLHCFDAVSLAEKPMPLQLPGGMTPTAFFCSHDTLFFQCTDGINTRFSTIRVTGNKVIDTITRPCVPGNFSVKQSGLHAGQILSIAVVQRSGLYVFNPKTIQQEYVAASSWAEHDKVTCTTISDFDATAFWLNSYNGSYLVDSKTFLPKRHLFEGYAVSDIIRDFQGNYWVSTLQNGLLKASSLEFIRHDNASAGWPDERCYVLCDAPGGLFVGHGNGVVSRTGSDGSLLDTFARVSSKEVEALDYDSSSGQLYAVLMGVWSHSLQPGTGWKDAQFGSGGKHLQHSGDSIFYTPSGPTSICSAKWTEKQLTEKIPPQHLITINDLLWDEGRKKIWAVSRSSGLYTLAENGTTIPFDTTLKASRMLLHKGTLWLLDPEKGLFFYDPATRKRTAVAPLFFAGSYPRLMTHDDNTIYVLCNNLMVAIDCERPDCARLMSTGFSFSSYNIKDIRCRFGRMWFATFKGLYSIPVTAMRGFTAPRPHIGPLLVNESLPADSTTLSFGHDQNNLRLQFDLVDFSAYPYRFAYRLNQSSQWQLLEPNVSSLPLSALSPDVYRLELAIVMPGGNIVPVYTRSFEILSPFWKTGWFYAFLLILLLGLLSLFYRSRIRRIRMRGQLELSQAQHHEQIQALQLSAIRARLNPHFMYNILNAIQGSIAINNREMAGEIITRFADLSRKILDASLDEETDLRNELDTAELYLGLENIRFEGQLHYTFVVDPAIDPTAVMIPSMLIQPLVENAVLHGLRHKEGEKELFVRVKKTTGSLVIEIEDNGIGFDAAAIINAKRARHRSFGLEALQKRLQLAGGISRIETIDKKTEGGTGVLVRLTIGVKG